MTRRTSTWIIHALIVALLAATPTLVAAISFENVGATLGLGSKDLKSSVITFIQWILGLLALIAVIMILYGFFSLATGGGNEDRAATAKRVITAAIIGLVVVLIAWAIVIFAANVIANTAA